jgi:hypothetical protein
MLAGSVVVGALALTAVGCGAHVAQLKEAAAADLNCPKNRVHVLNSGRTRDIEACGQRATYHYEDGDWRMIARSGAAPAAAGPQPVMRAAPPGVAPAQPAPVNAPLPPSSPTGTPSQPPPSSPAPGGKQL